MADSGNIRRTRSERGAGEGAGRKDSSRNCIGICMAISILELTYLEMFSLAEIHGRLLRPGARVSRGPPGPGRTYSFAQPD